MADPKSADSSTSREGGEKKPGLDAFKYDGTAGIGAGGFGGCIPGG
jgi:hypothetical protein